jgi:hypothetical protein
MRRAISGLVCLVFLALSVATSGCSKGPGASQSPQTSNSSEAAQKPRTAATGSLVATPNPIKVCDNTGLGVTTLAWTFKGATTVEVHVGSPDGPGFARGEGDGQWDTGKWVVDGTIFYLQDVSGGRALTPENTIATVTVRLTKDGCK